MTFKTQSPRTNCDCKTCSAACYTLPGMLGVGDLERIMEFVEAPTTPDWIGQHFEASPGATVVMHSGEVLQIPTIVPKLTQSGCIFLQEGRCTIHPVSPVGCSHFDSHMSQHEGQYRSGLVLREIMKDHTHNGDYSRAWHLLMAADLRATDLQTRRDNLAELTRQIESERGLNKPKE